MVLQATYQLSITISTITTFIDILLSVHLRTPITLYALSADAVGEGAWMDVSVLRCHR